MSFNLSGKRILVTGACGSIGRHLIDLLLTESAPEELICIDNNESGLFFLKQYYQNQTKARFLLADVREPDKIGRLMEGVSVVFHTAAFKHVAMCEKSPFEAVKTNIVGTQNIISGAHQQKVDRVIFTSSDKAVNPTSVMGTSKLMAERLITAANSHRFTKGTIFASTRFGNVLGSSGSVIPVFKSQIEAGGPVTLTDPAMTRFIMSMDQAARLVIDSASLAKGGEVFITKMPAIGISDLAEVMIRELAARHGRRPEQIATVISGVQPGEKMYEELMSGEETRRAVELKRYFVVLPAHEPHDKVTVSDYAGFVDAKVTKPYNSAREEKLSRTELTDLLMRYSII